MTTEPEGRDVDMDRCIAEILERCDPDDFVALAITRSATQIRSAVERLIRRLAAHLWAELPASPGQPR